MRHTPKLQIVWWWIIDRRIFPFIRSDVIIQLHNIGIIWETKSTILLRCSSLHTKKRQYSPRRHFLLVDGLVNQLFLLPSKSTMGFWGKNGKISMIVNSMEVINVLFNGSIHLVSPHKRAASKFAFKLKLQVYWADFWIVRYSCIMYYITKRLVKYKPSLILH